MDAAPTEVPARKPGTFRKRLLLCSLIVFNGSVIGFFIVPMILRAPREIDVVALPADETSIFSCLDNLDLAEFTDFPLRGVQARRHMPLNVARGVALAPSSITIGLRRYRDLRVESRRNLGHLLCAGGDPAQVDEFCSRIEKGEIDAATVVDFTLRLRLLLQRRLTLRAAWIDALLSREWSGDQAGEIAFNLKPIVIYPGWPEYGHSDPIDRWTRSWQEFHAWWASHRSSMEALPGEPLHAKP